MSFRGLLACEPGSPPISFRQQDTATGLTPEAAQSRGVTCLHEGCRSGGSTRPFSQRQELSTSTCPPRPGPNRPADRTDSAARQPPRPGQVRRWTNRRPPTRTADSHDRPSGAAAVRPARRTARARDPSPGRTQPLIPRGEAHPRYNRAQAHPSSGAVRGTCTVRQLVGAPLRAWQPDVQRG